METLTCMRAIKRKKQLAYLLNCSNGNFTKNEKKLYFAVLKTKHKSVTHKTLVQSTNLTAMQRLEMYYIYNSTCILQVSLDYVSAIVLVAVKSS